MLDLVNKESDFIEKWANDNSKIYHSSCTKADDTYFNNSDDTKDLIVYDFTTLPQLESLLMQSFEEMHMPKAKEIAKFCAIASYKLKNSDRRLNRDDFKSTSDAKVPDYIYAL